MRTKLLSLVVSVCLVLWGCSYIPVRSDSLVQKSDTRYLDTENGPVQITHASTNTGKLIDVVYRDASVVMAKPCRVRYSLQFDFFRNASVSGRLPSGKKYLVKLDTGFPWYAAVTDTVVSENGLAIHPGNNPEFPVRVGLCQMDTLKIGGVTLVNPPCTYFDQHWELQMAGMSLWKEKSVLLGLRVMELFPYIVFDNPRREVEFGAQGHHFRADPRDQWVSYPFSIEDDAEGQRRLMVDLPVGGEQMHVLFDTGSPGNLQVTVGLWSSLSQRVKHSPLRKSEILFWQFGAVPCAKTRASELTIGPRTRHNTEVVILSPSNPFKTDYALVGIGFFENDVFALDFERNLMWIKKN